MRRVLFAAAILLATDVQAQARATALEWMSGTWVAKSGGAVVTESWVGPGNGLLVAANLSTWPNGRKFFEFLRIGETPEGLSYYASPAGKPPTEFRMKELGERRVVFENPDHEYPRRILYWRDGEALVARIEGTSGGMERHEEWRFERAR